MAQLSKVSGVAVGTMYHYFESKDVLIETIFLYISEKLGAEVQFSIEENALPFRERFNLLMKKGFNFYQNNPNYFFFHDTHNYSPLISNELREESRKNYQIAMDLINEGIEEGIFKKIESVLLVRWMYNSIISLIQISLNKEFKVTKNTVNTVIDMTWKGLT